MSEQQPGLAQAFDDARCDVLAAEVEVGHICLVRPDHGPHLRVLVSEVHEDHVEAMLCDDEHHLAAETDSVLDASATGYPAPLLVHGDVCARILKRRLVESVGHVTPELVQRVALRGRGLDFNARDLGRGQPITGESDPRWQWKLDKHRQLRTVRARASELGWEIYKLGDAGPRGA